jgi:S-disulfanyl-L-cysteine oxidoreductase SoxD
MIESEASPAGAAARRARRLPSWLWLALAPVVATALIAATALLLRNPTPAAQHFADAADSALVLRGKALYRSYCANCHGRNLQGQPMWQLTDKFEGRRAPAHDETGHTWQHADEDLFRMVKDGRFPEVPADEPSYMPAYAGRLDDHDILAVMAFIKARWPPALRVSQAMLNPDFRGMPKEADQIEWRLPPTCNAILTRQRDSTFR